MSEIWTTERQALALAECNRWIGTPHKNRIAKVGVGVDCINLVYEIIAAAGILERREIGGYNTGIGFKETTHRMKNAVKACVDCEELPATAPEFGDIVIFREGKFSAHGGFYANGKIWHSLSNRTVTKSEFAEWRPEVECLLRIKSIGLIGEPAIEKI